MALNYRVGDEPVPKYRLERFLGRGAIGEVWHATGPGGTDAALKIIDLAGGGVHGHKEFRALQLVKRIHHPNLTPIMGLWAKSEDGTLLDDTDTVQIGLCQPMHGTERVQNTMVVPAEVIGRRPTELIIAMGLGQKSLHDRLHECREQGLEGVPVGELLEYLEVAAKAIDFLNSPVHQLAEGTGAIVHCDIKPLNILIVGGAAQVCDFGLAHMVGKAQSTAATVGTIAYIAPETLQGTQPTPATDQYSLAISYFELRTGTLPYDEETVGAVMKAVLAGELNFSKLPEAEQAVIRRAAAKDPQDRYASAMEMVADLRRAVSGEPWGERRPGARLPGWLKVAAVTLLLATPAAIWWGISHRDGATPNGDKGRDTIEELLKHADQGLQSGDWRAAAADYSTILRDKPDEVRALIGRGKCRLELKDYGDAAGDLEAARRLRPDDADVTGGLVNAHNAMADEHALKEEFASAISDYAAALQSDPKDAHALLGRGKCHLRLKDYGTALDDLLQAGDVVSPDGKATLLLADAYHGKVEQYLDKQQWKEAHATLEGAMGRVPDQARLLVQMARAAMGMGLTDEALRRLNRAIELDSRNAEAYYCRSEVYLKNKQYEEAIRDLEKAGPQIESAKGLKPFGQALLELGTRLRDEDKLDEAIRQFGKGVKYDPDNALLWSRLGTTQFRRENLEEAAKSLGEAIRCGTEDVDLDLVYRGRIWRVMAARLEGDKSQAKACEEFVKKARDDLLEATKRNPKNGDAHFLLAEAYARLDQYDLAIQEYTKAIELNEPSKWQWCDLKEAHFWRGHCYILTDRLDEAAKDFSILFEKLGEPNIERKTIATALHELAAKYARKRQLSEAAKWNSKGVEQAPDDATKDKYRTEQRKWEAEKSK
jgi:tetratricopeptide (TPR) repeat protein